MYSSIHPYIYTAIHLYIYTSIHLCLYTSIHIYREGEEEEEEEEEKEQEEEEGGGGVVLGWAGGDARSVKNFVCIRVFFGTCAGDLLERFSRL